MLGILHRRSRAEVIQEKIYVVQLSRFSVVGSLLKMFVYVLYSFRIRVR